MVASCNRSIMTALMGGLLLFKEIIMLVGYLTVKETAEKWGINPRTVQTMCNDGRIANAKKFGKAWAIPENTEKPVDKRGVSGNYKNWRTKYNKMVTE